MFLLSLLIRRNCDSTFCRENRSYTYICGSFTFLIVQNQSCIVQITALAVQNGIKTAVKFIKLICWEETSLQRR